MAETCSCKNESCCSTGNGQPSATPNCIRCLRQKLRAVSAAVFLRDDSGWWLECFQGDKPSDDAEAEFQYMLKAGVPDAILENGQSFILTNADEIASVFPQVTKVLEGYTVIASPVQHNKTVGVRIAWRDQAEPFTEADLTALRCHGDCPDGCLK